MFVTDGRGSAIFGDRDDDNGQVKFVFGAIGNLNRAVDPVVVNLGRIELLKLERANDSRLKSLCYGMTWMT